MKRLLAASAAALLICGCSSDGSTDTNGSGGTSAGRSAGSSAGSDAPTSEGPPTGRITVFAAASLRESFTALEKSFEKTYPDADVVLSFGPSSGLATQITQGAPADVFASASPETMKQVTSAGDADAPTVFAQNRMTVVTPGDNPGQVTGVESLGESDVKTAVCQEQVPCGAVAATIFERAGITVEAATEEVDVKAVLTKVQLGEVDAGLVYVTDAKAAGKKVRSIDIPEDQNASTDYPIAPLAEAPNAQGAAAFVKLVRSAEGQRVLREGGFAPAP